MNFNLLSATTLMGISFAGLTPNLYPEPFNQIDATFFKIQSNKTTLKAQQQPKIVSTRGYDFEFTGCEAISTDELTCGFIVVNNQQTRTLQLFTQQSKIIDDKGNVILGAVSQLGEMAILGGTWVEGEELPPKIPIKGQVLFRNIPSEATINLNYVEFNFDQFKIWFTPGK